VSIGQLYERVRRAASRWHRPLLVVARGTQPREIQPRETQARVAKLLERSAQWEAAARRRLHEVHERRRERERERSESLARLRRLVLNGKPAVTRAGFGESDCADTRVGLVECDGMNATDHASSPSANHDAQLCDAQLYLAHMEIPPPPPSPSLVTDAQAQIKRFGKLFSGVREAIAAELGPGSARAVDRAIPPWFGAALTALAELRASHEAALGMLRVEHATALARLRVEHATALAELRAEHAAAFAQLQPEQPPIASA
jgi:hypothetical protein